MHARTSEAISPLTLSRHRHGPLIGCLDRQLPLLARSLRFAVYGLSDDVIVVHDFAAGEIDNNVGGYVAHELLPMLMRTPPAALSSGWPAPLSSDECVQALFERCVGAIVRSADASERQAWHLFYDNTLAALRDPARPAPANGYPDFIGSFRAIYGRCADLVAEVPRAQVLDVATCFGFLPLFLAETAGPARIVGCDLNSALTALAEDYRRQRGVVGVSFVRADVLACDFARTVAGDGGGFDVVTAIHLLEHLDAEQTLPAFDALWGLARRRLILAVPFEDVPDATFGHRQVFDEAGLFELGRRTNARVRCFSEHGGWLVCDRDAKVNGAEEVMR